VGFEQTLFEFFKEPHGYCELLTAA
jgi:hypothetical protein